MIVRSKWEVPVDKHFKVTVSDKMDALKFMKQEKSCGYKMGISVEMKL
jgi:hypothetical protein